MHARPLHHARHVLPQHVRFAHLPAPRPPLRLGGTRSGAACRRPCHVCYDCAARAPDGACGADSRRLYSLSGACFFFCCWMRERRTILTVGGCLGRGRLLYHPDSLLLLDGQRSVCRRFVFTRGVGSLSFVDCIHETTPTISLPPRHIMRAQQHLYRVHARPRTFTCICRYRTGLS